MATPPPAAIAAMRTALDKAIAVDDNPAYLLGQLLNALARGGWQIIPASELNALRATKAAAYAFAEEMADYCSPYDVAAQYAGRLAERLNDAGGAQ